MVRVYKPVSARVVVSSSFRLPSLPFLIVIHQAAYSCKLGKDEHERFNVHVYMYNMLLSFGLKVFQFV